MLGRAGEKEYMVPLLEKRLPRRGARRGGGLITMRLKGIALAFLVVLGLSVFGQAQTFTTLHDFTGGSDGATPIAGVIQGRSGNLYGTTYGGGRGYGVIYKVNTTGAETVLYTFCSQTNCMDGANPETPLTRDKKGNLYGTTYYGGSGGFGTAFKIDTARKGKVLYNFMGSYDDHSCDPLQGLVMDNAHNLYGTTHGCSVLYGTIFEIDSAGKFTEIPSDSEYRYPEYGHLTMDKAGNLYGETSEGGTNAYGSVYELPHGGKFTELYSFTGGTSDGLMPQGSVVVDETGNLYGTTFQGGSSNYGTIWKVDSTGTETILHNFAGGTSDGCYPSAGVTLDSDGNLFGVTRYCGAEDYGALYELSASGVFILLHSFQHSDGAGPMGEVLRTAKGRLYGTTTTGGSHNYGTVWSYVP